MTSVIPRSPQLAQGTGLYNLTRQLGGSLGIALMATLLSRFTATRHAILTEHVGAIDVDVQSRLDMIAGGLMSYGVNPIVAKQQALMVLDRQISAQASVLAFSKIYLLNGMLLLCALPLLLLWKTGRGRGSVGAAH